MQISYAGSHCIFFHFWDIPDELHADIGMIRPELVKKAPCTLAILDKVLAKASEKRYQTGAEFAIEVRKCLKNIKKK